MATIKQGILGAFSGKVGGVVGSSWKGIAVMKSLPPSVSNPKTAKQVIQRGKMSSAVAFAKEILPSVIKPLNDRFVSRMSGYNSFIQENISLFEGGVLTKPEDLQISPRKNKAQLIDAVSTGPGAKGILVRFTSDAGTGFALDTDVAYVVVADLAEGLIAGGLASGTRADGEMLLDVPWVDNDYSGTLNVWMAFLRDDGTVPFATAHGSMEI